MKPNKLTSLVAGITIPLALVSGCSQDLGARLKLLDVSVGGQNAVYREKDKREDSDKVIFDKDCQPYDDSTISNQAIKNTALWKNYQNRDK